MNSHRKLPAIALAFAVGAAVLAPAATALAQPYNGEDSVRRDYDARYGAGAYDNYYANQNRYNANQNDYNASRNNYYADQNRARRDYDARYGAGAYDRYYGAQADTSYRQDQRECHQEKKGNQVAGGLIGGIAGAVLGSNVARGGGREGGAIIGGVGGAALGATIAGNQSHCDD